MLYRADLVKVSNRSAATAIDELTAVAALFFSTSSILSFLAMRRSAPRRVLFARALPTTFFSVG